MVIKNYFIVLSLIALLVTSISACAPTKAGRGGMGGAAAGAIAGQAIGRDTEATLLGAAIGGIAGYIIGNEMDKADRKKVAQTYENVPDQQTTSWENPNTQNKYKVTPQRTYEQNDRPCREVVILATIDGEAEKIHQTACRNSQAKWVVQ